MTHITAAIIENGGDDNDQHHSDYIYLSIHAYTHSYIFLLECEIYAAFSVNW